MKSYSLWLTALLLQDTVLFNMSIRENIRSVVSFASCLTRRSLSKNNLLITLLAIDSAAEGISLECRCLLTLVAEGVRICSYGKPGCSDDEVESAASASAIHDAITTRFPKGYDTIVGGPAFSWTT